jgi:hypothetical protein
MSNPKWVWWSTHETIQNEVPSITAILETIIAVSIYWWIALHGGMILPLLISAALAPMVLLRSEKSVALGLEWFMRFEDGQRADKISKRPRSIIPKYITPWTSFLVLYMVPVLVVIIIIPRRWEIVFLLPLLYLTLVFVAGLTIIIAFLLFIGIGATIICIRSGYNQYLLLP